jgi:glycosyltransferase involved in cell wall biosynthesis
MLRSKRILSLDPAGLLWGSERALLDFLGEIPGYEAACCLPPGSPLMPNLQERGIRCFSYFQKNLHQRGVAAKGIALLGLMLAILKFRPHVLHVNQAGATRIALAACRVFKIPCVSHVRLLEDVAYLNALQPSPHYLKHLIAISPPIAEEIARQPALRDIPCTMLLDGYRAIGGQVPKVDLPQEWDLVCIGRLAESKGQELMIQALEILTTRGLRPKTVFVGEINECGRRLQEKVRDAGLAGSVEFAGHRDHVEEILLRTKWLVCPSGYEPLGRVLFEAWDFGIPVIAGATSGGAAASVCGSEGGFLFDEWTPRSLAESLEKALGMDTAEQTRMAEKGRSWMIDATDPDHYASCIGRLCDQLTRSSYR